MESNPLKRNQPDLSVYMHRKLLDANTSSKRLDVDDYEYIGSQLERLIAGLPIKKLHLALENVTPPHLTLARGRTRIVTCLEGHNVGVLPHGFEMETRVVEPGEVIYIGSNSWFSPLYQSLNQFLLVEFTLDQIHHVWCQRGPEPEQWYHCTWNRPGGINTAALHVIRAIEVLCQSESGKADSAAIISLVEVLWRQVYAEHQKGVGNDIGSARYRWLQMVQYIEHILPQAVARDHIASEFRVHPNHVSRLFRQFTGEGFTDFVTQKRIDLACTMLHAYQLSIKEIADRCGFCDAVYFRRVFKKRLGVSPNNYRKGAVL